MLGYSDGIKVLLQAYDYYDIYPKSAHAFIWKNFNIYLL